MLATVDALLPLSLLEAVRNVDTPSDQLDTEYVDELRNKRLGLSDTVYAQIKRHSEAVKRGQRTGQDESIALARLIGRRPDAEAVFRAAGRYMARQSYHTISPVTRKMMRAHPSTLEHPTSTCRNAIHRRARAGTARPTAAAHKVVRMEADAPQTRHAATTRSARTFRRIRRTVARAVRRAPKSNFAPTLRASTRS